jgi:hypothetical protein
MAKMAMNVRMSRIAAVFSFVAECLSIAIGAASCRLFFPAKSGWEAVGKELISGRGVMDPAFPFIDSQGRPCVVFQENQSFPASMNAKAFDGQAWIPLSADSDPISADASEFFGGSFLAALDAAGNPVLAYESNSNSINFISIKRFSGASWTTMATIESYQSGQDSSTRYDPKALTQSPQGATILAMLETVSAIGAEPVKTLRFHEIGNSGLQPAAIPSMPATGGFGDYCLAFSPAGQAFLSTCEDVANTFRVKAYSLEPAGWSEIGAGTLPYALNARIHFSSDGAPLLAFMEGGFSYSGFRPRLYILRNGLWSDYLSQPVDFFSESSIFGSAAMADGSILLAFAEESMTGGEISVLRFAEDGVGPLGVREFTNGDYAQFPGLHASPDGTILLTFSEGGHDARLSAMKYVGF